MKKLLFWVVLAVFWLSGLGAAMAAEKALLEMGYGNSQLLPQVVFGPQWTGRILTTNLSRQAGEVTYECFEENGQTAVCPGSDGPFSIRTVAFGPREPKEIFFDRQPGAVKQVWIKITSTSLMWTTNFLDLCQDVPGNDPACARVLPSAARPGFSLEADPNNGLAIVNPHRDTTKVKIYLWSQNGREENLLSQFDLAPGEHRAAYLWQEPFRVPADQRGTVVVSSSLPVSAVGLSFRGLNFLVLPLGADPRITDMSAKTGIVQFVPTDKTIQANLAERIQDALGVYNRRWFTEEMLRNGFEPIYPPVDPTLITVTGSEPHASYLVPGSAAIDFGKVFREAKLSVPADWKAWLIIGRGFELRLKEDGTSEVVNGHFPTNSLYIPGLTAPFLDSGLLGSKENYTKVSIPELGGFPMPLRDGRDIGETFGGLSATSFRTLAHEWFGHRYAGLHFHSMYLYDDYSVALKKYGPLGGCTCGSIGLFLSASEKVEVLTPIEAKALWTASYRWIEEDRSPPQVTIVSKEHRDGYIRVTFLAEDEESSISHLAIAAESIYVNGWPEYRFYREVGHQERGAITVIIPSPEEVKFSNIHLSVFNTKGLATDVLLF